MLTEHGTFVILRGIIIVQLIYRTKYLSIQPEFFSRTPIYKIWWLVKIQFLIKETPKKNIFSWSESIEIFMIKFCKLYVLLIKSLKLRSYFFSSLVFFFKYFPLQYSTRPWLSNNTIFSNNWIKNCGLIALIKQVATQLLTKNSKRLQIVRYQRLSCEDKLYTIKFT